MRFLAIISACLLLASCAAPPSQQAGGFRFEDYSRGRSIEEIKKEFPARMSREAAEKKLVTEAGARQAFVRQTPANEFNKKPQTSVLYRYDTHGAFITYGYAVTVTYDANNKIVWINASGDKIPAGRVDPKVDPMHFSPIPWMKFLPSGEEDLTSLLLADFPSGTSRAEVEQYLLASGKVKIKEEQSFSQPDGYQIKSVTYVEHEGECDYVIHALYSPTGYSTAPLESTKNCVIHYYSP